MTAALPEAQREAVLAKIPLGRVGTPADIAPAVVYLASAAGAWVTGQVLRVNGGMYL
jgi:3-oxoacyl-[acyl-carrier protein] reductase